MEYNLKTPLKKEDIEKLNAGDIVYISGEILTARDEAHARILEMGDNKEALPFSLEGAVIYHCGPLMQQTENGWKVVSAGPTTSGRMSKMTPPLLKAHNVRAIIGKGGMKGVADALKNGSVYLAYTGGCAALAAELIKEVKAVYWLDLGMPEAVWVLRVEKFGPLIVGIDVKGKDIFAEVREKAQKQLEKQG
ncbi:MULTISPECIES: FumA C-terminus/TtdB family hydratase beta subunit [Methanosarcina]|uniref:Fumarate hydratase class I, aerobic n=3 Tax=Methanosarcina barkeri TaxID=2208 RepID=A0A0E3QVD6_METBA|nr:MULTISPECIES: FumA C-terminus/TtdB family hydratase beta subunit [Methanosarcina]AKB54580.1 Fumarate hydratase class I, aerobic [Methanosarcina barkeri MS]AKB57343.1 Fumarate hydratase class I, aerobic [Methanosarcina barkeri 227]AKJ37901.1 fumarase beta subunit FumB [Methanosarcina barkeri CM1]OED07722.1 fumarate hydratase [Methanosarcina sp. A14]